jgi:translin
MLSEIGSRLFNNFEDKDEAREKSLRLSRNIIRLSGRAIKSIHREQYNDAELLIEDISKLNNEILSLLKIHPDIYHAGFVENAQTEYAEAAIIYHLLTENRIPEPAELNVEDSAFLLGLGDVVGELRRIILDLIRKDKPYDGEKYLEIMDEIFSTIILFDFPDALSKGLRHKGDVARSLVEKTRGDLTIAIGNARLDESMTRLEEKLE